MRSLICLLINVVLALPSSAQPYDNDEAAAIQQLRSQKIDTILTISDPEYNFTPGFITIKNLGEITLEYAVHIVYPKNGNLVLKRLLWHWDTAGTHDHCLESQEIVLARDTLFSWLRQNLETIRHENIYPYIFKGEDKGAIYYEYMRESHPSYYKLSFYMGVDSFYNYVTSLDITRRGYGADPKMPENLNYSINTSTKLYALFVMVQQYIGKAKDSFEFEKSQSP